MTREEALKEIELAKKENRYANLRGANLYEANLIGVNLRGADIRYADLSGANLSGANLYEANLSGANLREADLREANLYEADLREANLDYSCWALWCGTAKSNIKIDKKQAAQLLYHACIVASQHIKIPKTIINFISKYFHRYNEVEKL